MTAAHGAGGWRKSSYSSQTENCVEINLATRSARIRDTKARHQGNLTLSPQA